MKRFLYPFWAIFRLRFNMGLQYRIAAFAGILTQFVWGFMECFVYRAFYETNPAAFPMAFSAVIDYIWLKEAFLSFFTVWMMDYEIFGLILNGDIAYELCRPIFIYDMWFAKNIANRLSRAVLRFLPILTVAFLLPQPFRISLPDNFPIFFWFFVTMVLGLLITVAFCMLVYLFAFFTVSPEGVKLLFISVVEFFSGAVIPLPFFPERIKTIFALLPFAGMQNVPLRIYSGDLVGKEMAFAIILQVFWLTTFLILGKGLCKMAERRIIIQGG